MSASEELRSYVRQLQQRFRLGVLARGTAILAGIALLATVVLTVIASRFAFSRESLWSARAVLLVALALGTVFGLAIPLWHWSQRWWIRRAERAFPQFEQRLLTFTERDRDGQDPFLELLAADTLRVADTADVKAAAPDGMLVALLSVGMVSLGTLVWLIRAGPGYFGYGAAALWRGPPAAPFYVVHVSPGDATVRRHTDQLVTAELPGLQGRQLRIHVHYQSAPKWEQTTMQQRPMGAGFQFLFAGIPEDIEYYVEAGSVQTQHFHLRVVDIPVVKQIRVTYHPPEWMHMADTVEEHGGDLRAVEGTQAQLEVITNRPLPNGALSLDDGREIALSATGGGNTYRGAITLDKDGAYHVVARYTAQEQRISEDYFIQSSAVKPPEVAVVRPERDYRASPIEEVTLAATANDPFGLSELAFHYSVNGGPEKTVDLLQIAQAGNVTQAKGDTVLSLEALKLAPGDVVGFYAVAKDARSESHSDISFIQIEPFEREFSQSQQAGAGAGGGLADDQSEIAEREKEIIAATWQRVGLKNAAAQEASEQAKFLSDVQNTLRGQALALAGRLQMRDLQLANEQFGSFQQDMAAAAAAMTPAAQKLDAQQWSAAVFDEQKALQYLLRAEATFRQIQVAFGSRAGSGAVNSAGRDLASLFDLELDTQKNQYESAQTQSTSSQQSSDVDAALKKLDELARRQSELAEQHGSDAERSAEERWQQEMLRRKAEELQQQLERLARDGGQQGGADAAEGKSGPGRSSGASSGRGGAAGANARGGGGVSANASASARQALDRLRQAEDDMRRAVDEHNVADARRAAERLHEAMNLLGGMQRQDASRQVDSLAREAERLENQQREQAVRMRELMSSRLTSQGSAGARRRNGSDGEGAVEGLINDRQKLADDLARLTQDMRSAERATRKGGQGATRGDGASRGAAKKLRDALGDLEQADTETQLQRSADQLRRGYAPLTDTAETEIAAELEHLKQQLGDAQQAMANANGQRATDSDSALDAMERLRSRLAAWDRNGAKGRVGTNGQAGESDPVGANGRPGANERAGGSDRGGGSDPVRGGRDQGGAAGGGDRGGINGPLAGPIGRGDLGGNRGGPVNGGWNTGNNSELPHPVAPDTSATPPDPEEVFKQGMRDVDQLRRSVGDDPAARGQVDDLIRAMEKLDPKRFPGNPARVDELYARVLGNVDKLELQLRHEPDDAAPAQVRSDSPMPVPAGYQAAAAEYFRRLSKSP